MYFNNIASKNGDNKNIDVAYDKAIFRHLILYQEQKSEIKLILGAWYISKEMCNTLITIFQVMEFLIWQLILKFIIWIN